MWYNLENVRILRSAPDLLGGLLGGPLGHLLDQSERGPRFLVAQVYRTAVEIVYDLGTRSTGERGRSARLATCDHTMTQRQATRYPVLVLR